MKIVVLIKRVPDTETKVVLTEDALGIKEDGVKFIISPYDEFAVEEALRTKEKAGGEVVVVSVGKKESVEQIRTALAMGADRGVLVNDEAVLKSDAQGVAKALAAAIKKEGGVDLIFAGKLAIDDYGASVAQSVAEILGAGQMMVVDSLEVDAAGKKAKATRRVEGGAREVLEGAFPLLVACEKGLNEPRYASLPGIMKAKKKEIKELRLADLGLDAAAVAPKLKTIKMVMPPERAAGKKIEPKDAQEAAKAIVDYLHNEAKLI